MENNEDVQNVNKENNLAQLGFISTITIVNLLIEKGICTADELLNAEKKRREQMEVFDKLQLVQTPAPHNNAEVNIHKRHEVSWLRRKMSKKRWTRRLAKKIFGWEYKKVVVDKGGHHF